MKTVSRRSLVDLTIDQLMAEISGGNWPIGSKIPPEATLVETMGVSRSSVREAVKALVQQGLLSTRQGVGTYVLARDATQVAIRRALNHADAGEVLTVRSSMDTLAATEAAAHRTAEDIHILEEILRLRSRAIRENDFDEFVAQDLAFHLAVAAATHNTLLTALYQSFDESLRQSIAGNDCFFSSDQLTETEPHSKLLRAIADADREAARQATQQILEIAHSAVASGV
ncbi:FadR/GntR family transcriptional regulator [Paeniglutamicibacter sp. NPDC012692]|uniref:FadR/GntR family transcriptional regulator n=1 Tax=Paeniglutamicibacter sp. NPDC012692 TaxID=3364388 RepID=UPI0036C071B6